MSKELKESKDSEDISKRWRYKNEPGENGFGYQNFYRASPTMITEVPEITYNGAFFSGDPEWKPEIPKEPEGQFVFVVPIRYQAGTPHGIIEGIALLGTVPKAAPTPPTPPVTTTPKVYSNGIEYGLASGNNPEGDPQQTDSFTLAVNKNYSGIRIDFPATTDTADNYYIKLPDGLDLVKAVDSVQGDETDSWTKIPEEQIWVFEVGFPGANNTFTMTVRRES